jgi:glycosyltransferase involved in cell wall biosynthesis
MKSNTYANIIENQITRQRNPSFSIIIPYRNRTVDSLQRCLESLKNQSLSPKEIIVVDYGSTPECAEQVKYICQKINFCKYIYSETRGYFWNRGEALNIGLKYSQGEIISILDSDLIVPKDFLEILTKKIKKKHFLVYQFIYLNESFNNYDNLFLDFDFRNLRSSSFLNAGNLASFREDLFEINGYDTYFRIWGGEDINLASRLISIGIVKENIDKEEMQVFHQWHDRSNSYLPKGWLSVFTQKNQNPNIVPTNKALQTYVPKGLNERPALIIYLEGNLNLKKNFVFEFPIERSFAQFLSEFNILEPANPMIICQNFQSIRITRNSKIGGFLKKFNYILKKLRISYRITDIHTYDTEYIDFQKVYAFIFYFILHNEAMIQDYYLNIDPQQELIECLIIKK